MYLNLIIIVIKIKFMEKQNLQFLVNSIQQSYPYYNQFIVKDSFRGVTFQQWVISNMQGFQHRLTVFKIQNISGRMLAQTVEEFLIKLLMQKFNFSVFNFKYHTTDESSTIHFSRFDQKKLELLEALKRIKVKESPFKCNQKQVPVEIENTDFLLQFLMTSYPTSFKDYFRSFMQFLMIRKCDQAKKYIKYCKLQQSIHRLQQSVQNCKRIVSIGDVIITNQQDWQNFLQLEKFNSKKYHQLFTEVVDNLIPSQISQTRNLLVSSASQENSIDQSNQSHLKYFAINHLLILFNQSVNEHYLKFVNQISKMFKVINKCKMICLNITNYGLLVHNQEKTIRYFKSILQQKQYRKRLRKVAGKKIESIFISIRSISYTQKLKKIRNLRVIRQKLQGFFVHRNYMNKQVNYRASILQKFVKGFLIKQIALRQYNNAFFTRQIELRIKRQKDCNDLIDQINTYFENKGLRNLSIECQISFVQIHFPCFESLINLQRIKEFMKVTSALCVQLKTTLVKLQASNTQIKAYFQNGKCHKISIQTQQEPQLLSSGVNMLIKNLPRQSVLQRVVSEDQRYGFILDLQQRLYGIGQNKFGQLGLGNIQYIKQFRKIPIRQKIIGLSTRNKRTLCLTQDQKLYYFGVYSNKNVSEPISIRTNFIPRNTKVQNVCCSSNKDYLLLTNGDILQISVMKSKVLNRIVLNKNRRKESLVQINVASFQQNNQIQQFNDTLKSINTTKCSLKSINSSKSQLQNKFKKNISKSSNQFIPDFVLLDLIGGTQLQILYSRRVKINSFDEFKRKQIISWMKQKHQSNTVQNQSFLIQRIDQKENIIPHN